MSTKSCHQGQIEIEFLDEPIDVCAAIPAEYFGDLRPLRATFQSVRSKKFNGIINPIRLLSLSGCSINAASGFRGVAATE
jgi:hypothetical protein